MMLVHSANVFARRAAYRAAILPAAVTEGLSNNDILRVMTRIRMGGVYTVIIIYYMYRMILMRSSLQQVHGQYNTHVYCLLLLVF